MNGSIRQIARLLRPGGVFALFGVALWLTPALSWAQDKQPTLDELLDIRPPADLETTPPGADHPPGDSAGLGTEQDASELAPQPDPDGQPSDLFDQTIHEMRDAADRLGQRFDAGIETQRVQQSILDKLDQIIAAAKQQQSGGGGGGSGGSEGSAQQQDVGSAQNAGAQQSMTGAVSSGMGSGGGGGGAGQVPPDTSAGPLQTHRSQWGSLPPRLRDELQQGFNEPFSSVYSELTGEYYRRLAEESR